MEEKLSEEELTRRLGEAAKQVSIGASYRHYKNKTYKVLNLAILEATHEIYVIYQAQYGAGLTFIRPLTDWFEEVQWQNKKLKRFTKLTERSN